MIEVASVNSRKWLIKNLFNQGLLSLEIRFKGYHRENELIHQNHQTAQGF